MVATLRGTAGHDIITAALDALRHLEHRGAVGSDAGTGDGAGIITQIPDGFLRSVTSFPLPSVGSYAVGNAFLPVDPTTRSSVKRSLANLAAAEGLEVLGWREVPVRPDELGTLARAAMPVVQQLFVKSSATTSTGAFVEGIALDRLAFRLRKRAERELELYFASLSCRTMVYKGMVTTLQLEPFYPDLSDERFTSKLALVHSRYSTNTFPSWPLAQPFRMIAHNGEINTIQGNRNWMRARQSQLESEVLGDLTPILPIVTPGASDSASFDEVVELLTLAGRSLPHADHDDGPEAWENQTEIDPERRAFYEYHSMLMEPWTARPRSSSPTVPWSAPRSTATDCDPVATSSPTTGSSYSRARSACSTSSPAASCARAACSRAACSSWTPRPGASSKTTRSRPSSPASAPWGDWLDEGRISLSDLPEREHIVHPPASVNRRQRTFGYTEEEVKILLAPMARTGAEPLGAMGSDTPIAVLSKRPRLLFDYFTQQFAQVTNPPLDSIREAVVTSLGTSLAPNATCSARAPSMRGRCRCRSR
jgi:glutamate synthase (NADPH/NADH) large chain